MRRPHGKRAAADAQAAKLKEEGIRVFSPVEKPPLHGVRGAGPPPHLRELSELEQQLARLPDRFGDIVLPSAFAGTNGKSRIMVCANPVATGYLGMLFAAGEGSRE